LTQESPVEIEATLAFVGENRITALQAIASRQEFLEYWRTSFRRLFLHDRYYDLPDGELTRVGAALRWRRLETVGRTTNLMALKGPAERDPQGVSLTRLELEKEWSPSVLREILAEVPGLGVESPPESLDDASDPEQALAAAGLELVQDRRTRRLVAELRDGASAVAELALDHVCFDARGRRVDHREVEIELLAPERRECLERIATELLREFPRTLRIWVWSKAALGRALERLADEGTLDPLLSGNELTTAGYDAIEDLLVGQQ